MRSPLHLCAAALAGASMLFAGCAETPVARREPVATPAPATVSVSQLLRRPGGTYTDDGPDGRPPVDLDAVRDAMPRFEPLHAEANEPYTVFGREYVPAKVVAPFRRQGTASWYGRKFHGQRTTSGEIYDMYAMTAAHPTLPVPSYARVTNLENRRSVVVRVNDRGPFASGRIMDLSYAAAHRLGFVTSGSAHVEVEAIVPERSPTVAASASGPAAPAAVAPGTTPRPASAQSAAVSQPVAPLATPAAAPLPAQAPAASAVSPGPRTVPEVAAALPAQNLVQPTAAPRESAAGGAEPAAASADAAREAEPQMPLASDASGVFLQLGAFSVRANAEAFRARLVSRLSGPGAALALTLRDGLYRVQLGPFRDRAEASRAAREVREQIDLRPIVVVR